MDASQKYGKSTKMVATRTPKVEKPSLCDIATNLIVNVNWVYQTERIISKSI